jgi:hypothetical protein
MTKKFKYEAPRVMDLTGFSASGQAPLACGFGALPPGGTPGGDVCNPGYAAGTTGCASGYTVNSGTTTCTDGFGYSATVSCAGGANPGVGAGCFTGNTESAPFCGTGSAV